jgi:hypothetical protein
VLPSTISVQRFEAVARWHPKIVEDGGAIELAEFSQCRTDDSAVQFSAVEVPPELTGGAVGERLDHRHEYNGQRYMCPWLGSHGAKDRNLLSGCRTELSHRD